MISPDDALLAETTDGVRIHSQTWAGGDNGHFLFVPGLGADSSQFAADAQHFADLGYSSTIISMRGHGLSTAPTPLTRKTLTVEKMAQDLGHLIDCCADKSVHVVGNSLGGLVALHAAHDRPDKIVSLAIFGTTLHLNFPPGIAFAQYVIGRTMGVERLAGIVAKNATRQDRARDVLLRMYRAVDLGVTYRIQQNIRKYDYREIAADLAVPVMLLRGEHDKDINRNLASTLALWANNDQFEVKELADAGHFANLDQPDAFRKALAEFVRRVPTG
ncbi:alpha/beta hydrolase [Pacificimonas sp. WHA3]|uniref:Alpha/beta hydrolase n=1 Tax=Pacificimonas pallii TaxID=2827236 RepID=A0ABS6SAH5_9SPHN|nr:alpha/beta hydrolase [Pacificimonas pallii]MBV7255325.1 alpha/beta hydrolase [Pacificimonas pallii]